VFLWFFPVRRNLEGGGLFFEISEDARKKQE